MTQQLLFEVERPRQASTPEPATPPRQVTKVGRKRQSVAPVDGSLFNHSLGVDNDGRRVWTLTFPSTARMISVNGNPHWRTTSPARKTLRETMFVYAGKAGLPTGLSRVRIEFELRFPTNGRRDAGNYHPNVAKPCVDALGPTIDTIRNGKPLIGQGYELIPDDTVEHLDGPFVRLGPSGKKRGAPFGEITVTITDLTGDAA